MREYKYIGSEEFLDLVSEPSDRCLIQNETDVLLWMQKTQQHPNSKGEVTVTFIVDVKGSLWIADRHSEHVVCASGGPVLSAGEMTFQIKKIRVLEVTNQSTGFCPEPESWPNVANALDIIGLAHPNDFTTHFHFRRCDECGSTNIVKENWFICSICDAELNPTWNFY